MAALLGLSMAPGLMSCTAMYGLPIVDGDADGDGYFLYAGPDCNDSDPSTHPGAPDPEGDGIDQNCDGVDGVRPPDDTAHTGETGR